MASCTGVPGIPTWVSRDTPGTTSSSRFRRTASRAAIERADIRPRALTCMQVLKTLSTSPWWAAILSGMAATVALAQAPPDQAPPQADTATLETQLVKTGLYLIQGGGGNSLMRFSASGIILVDGKLRANYRPLM